MSAVREFPTPEEAALAGWPSGARARVLRIEVVGDAEVDVIVDTEPSHAMRVHCIRRENGSWVEAGTIVE